MGTTQKEAEYISSMECKTKFLKRRILPKNGLFKMKDTEEYNQWNVMCIFSNLDSYQAYQKGKTGVQPQNQPMGQNGQVLQSWITVLG